MFTNAEMTQVTAIPENDSEIKTAEKIEHAPSGACMPNFCSASSEWVAAYHEDFCFFDGE